MIDRIPLGQWIADGIDLLTSQFSNATRAISDSTEQAIDWVIDCLMWIPEWAFILATAVIAWRLKGWRFALTSALGLGLIWNLELWYPMIETLTLVLFATLSSIVLALPIGIAAALNKTCYRIVMPVLDFMQTMPAFVYLIPAIPFFGLGPVAAIFATVIFAMPPAIRFTTLGIRQVPEELIEAADAFGAAPAQKLFKVQLPLAVPTIMAGINQTIMLSLSMVVISAMIGAGGLGGEVWRAINSMDMAAGFESGIAVVILAMILDRITQALGKGREQ
ncbi:proline/glycine betaine ABC transporter permease [Gallaecimonas pentaromativorans]